MGTRRSPTNNRRSKKVVKQIGGGFLFFRNPKNNNSMRRREGLWQHKTKSILENTPVGPSHTLQYNNNVHRTKTINKDSSYPPPILFRQNSRKGALVPTLLHNTNKDKVTIIKRDSKRSQIEPGHHDPSIDKRVTNFVYNSGSKRKQHYEPNIGKAHDSNQIGEWKHSNEKNNTENARREKSLMSNPIKSNINMQKTQNDDLRDSLLNKSMTRRQLTSPREDNNIDHNHLNNKRMIQRRKRRYAIAIMQGAKKYVDHNDHNKRLTNLKISESQEKGRLYTEFIVNEVVGPDVAANISNDDKVSLANMYISAARR